MNNREILRTLIILLGLAISIFLCKVGVDALPFAVDKNFDNKLIYLALANIGIGACSIIGLLISWIYPSFFQDDNIIGVFLVCVAYSQLGVDYFALGNAPEMRYYMLTGMLFSTILGSVVSLGIASSWMKYFQDN